MDEKTNHKIPVLFQTLKQFNVEDTRFTRVKIWLMHLEENMNGSYFTEEVVAKAIPTLANTPIMGLINPEIEDFEGHEREIEYGEDDFKLINITIPYGVIPETNQAQFEDRVGDDGVTRTYLTVEGLLWNKWEDAINVLNSKGGFTGQSMEIAEVHSGRFDNDGVFHFTDFKFDGACLLGDAVEPAMKNSSVELAFSDKVSSEINEKLAIYSRSLEEGGNKLEKENQEELKSLKFEDNTEEPTEPTPDEVTEPEETPEDGAEETPAEPENGSEEEAPVDPEPEEEPEEDPKPEEPEEPVEPSKPEVPEEPEAPEEPEEEQVASDDITTKTEDTVTEARKAIDAHDEKIEQPLDRITVGDNVYSLEEAVSIIKEHFALVQKLHEERVDELFAAHEDSLSDEEMSALKKDAYAKKIEELENAIFATIGRKSFAKKTKENPSMNFTSVSAPTSAGSDDPYDGVLAKYL